VTIVPLITTSVLFLAAGCAFIAALRALRSNPRLSAALSGVGAGCLATALGAMASSRADEMAGIMPAVFAGLAFWLVVVPSAVAAIVLWRAGRRPEGDDPDHQA
jgi:hypothetical protein